MGEAFIVRRGGVVEEVDTTATPTITEVSVTTDSITFTVTNNDTDEAIVYYDLDPVVDFSADSVTLDDGDTSTNITISDLDDDEEYIVYAIASAFGKQFSPQASLAITTDEIPPIPEFELLFDSDEEVTLPQTQIDITGLSIGKNDELRLVCTLLGISSTTTTGYNLFVNNETTKTNYHYQRILGSGTTFFVERVNDSIFLFGRNEGNVGIVDIKISENSRFVAQSYHSFRTGSQAAEIQNQSVNIVGSGFTLTDITKLTILANQTNGIAAGSRIRLYKVNTGDA
jgi:hypothetical protein